MIMYTLALFLMTLTVATPVVADSETHALRQYLKDMHKMAGSETLHKRTPEEQATAMKVFQQRFEEYRVAKKEAHDEQPFIMENIIEIKVDEKQEESVQSEQTKKTMPCDGHQRHESPKHYSQSAQQARAIQDFRQHLKASRSAWLEQTKQQVILQAEQ